MPKKLGIKDGMRVVLLDAPRGFRSLLEPLPENMEFTTAAESPLVFVHLFVKSAADLREWLLKLYPQLEPDGTIWVSWPKKSSGVKTDITEGTIRDVALPLGLVDIKVCAIDATWSGLKLVIRKANRGKPRR